MIPLAVNGPLVITVVVLASLVVLFLLLRSERDYHGDEQGESEGEPQGDGDGAPRPPAEERPPGPAAR